MIKQLCNVCHIEEATSFSLINYSIRHMAFEEYTCTYCVYKYIYRFKPHIIEQLIRLKIINIRKNND